YNLPDSLRISDPVPEGRVAALAESADLRERLVHLGTAQQCAVDDRVAGGGQQEVQVLDEGGEGGLARAGSEEQPGAADRMRAGIVQQRDEPAAADGIVA